VLRGVWPIAEFTRLPDVLHDTAGELEYAVSGRHDAKGRPALRIELRGILRLTCQRCLEPLEFPLAADALLTLARRQSEIDADRRIRISSAWSAARTWRCATCSKTSCC
jgi:uncharacterized protein